MIRVYIADDHAVVRAGIKQYLRDIGGFEVVGEAENGRQVLSARDMDRWDVLLLDLSLPVVSGIEVLRRVKARRPDLPVVIVSMYPEDQYERPMLAAGASAYIGKQRPPQDLVAAVRAAARGEKRSPGAAPAGPPHASLTKREHEVFLLIIEGRSVAEIAAELDVHSCTVSNHLAKLREKLGARTVADLVRYAHAAGLAPPGPPINIGR